MFCKECGVQLPDHVENFCPNCGNPIAQEGGRENVQQKVTAKPVKKKIPLKILIPAVMAIVVIAFMLLGGRNAVSDTKNIIFDQYGTISIGKAADKYLEKVDWEAEKLADDEYKVTLRAFSTEISAIFSMEFRVTYTDDMVYAKPRAISIAGDEYKDEMSLWEGMSIIYGQSIAEADEAYWAAVWGS